MSLDLYQKEILALAKRGSTPERLDAPDASARVDNALCGDRVTIDVTVSDGKITGLGHKVQGCALCQATTGLLMETAIGRRVEDVTAASEELSRYIGEEDDTVSLSWPQMAVFQPVRQFKTRLECVRLPLTALSRACAAADE